MFGRHSEGREGHRDEGHRHGRHRGEGCEQHLAGRGRHGFGGGRRGFGGRQGPGFGGGDDDTMHAGRMLAHGDLRLIALALIDEQPRHGYDIIKALEEKTSDWYSPSPGIVYPTLTYLEEVGYLTSQPEGAKKLFTITEEGRAHLTQNRAMVDAVMARIAFIGEKAARIREREGRDGERSRVPQLVRAAFENLRDVAVKRLADDADAEAKVVEILARAAGELKRVQ
jgi:DNA-binding PadR family transcriptional regulator